MARKFPDEVLVQWSDEAGESVKGDTPWLIANEQESGATDYRSAGNVGVYKLVDVVRIKATTSYKRVRVKK